MRLVRASEMQEMDRMTIQELGIPGVVLMENAARGATRLFLDHFTPGEDSHIVLLCGRGNNGGDGYVMARYLHEAGLKVSVVVLSEFTKISGDALTNLKVIRRMNLDVREVPGTDEWGKCNEAIKSCDFIIDGILGTGLNSPIRGFYGKVIEETNALKKPLMAIDIPSGLNADTGQIMGLAIEADLTVTFGFPKIGHVVFPGAGIVGRLQRVDIGIPDMVSGRVPSQYNMIEPDDFSHLLRTEKQDIHKGSRGHLLVLAGSTGKTGAATLTALGAIRAGAGLVTLGVPEGLNPVLENKLTEAMTAPLPETEDGSISLGAAREIERLIEGKTALALGPGLSTNTETVAMVRRIVDACPLPMVIDADGLNALTGSLGVLTHCRERAIITPHPGEMGRLTGIESSRVQSDRISAASLFVEEHGCYLALKGARTLVAEPKGQIHINPTGNPALSSGGAGDVLTGLIGGFLARGWPIAKAAIAGVYLHGMAADLLAEEMGSTGIYAGELLTVLPRLMASLSRSEWPLENPPLHEEFYKPL
ncbi:MAG: NAD(P)H-hydrate dehydratase [Thermodesulfobacteriota bacterium]|nr:NAD(P)H-hydrate dehydratase [Thermodesulfobacteriota bacterium]